MIDLAEAMEAGISAYVAHTAPAPQPCEFKEVCCTECGEAISWMGLTADQTLDRHRAHLVRVVLEAALPALETQIREQIVLSGSVACRECGCTDSEACFPICWWVEPDLCSACVRVEGVTP